MRAYGVIFSYYSEEYGNFETMRFEVEAADQFEARLKAWEAFDLSDEKHLASCVKLCGVVWEASPLDIQDYFNSLAAYEKCKIKEIDNAELPNDEIRREIEKRKNPESQSDESRIRLKNDRASSYGSLYAISGIARDCYKPLGIIPPDAYEEIHYARKFADWFNSNGMYEQEVLLLNALRPPRNGTWTLFSA